MSADTLEDLLDSLRTAARAGDLTALAAMPDRIEAALARGLPRDPARLHRLRAGAETAAGLLQAALKGVRAARRRAGEVRAHDLLSTYDASGRRDVVAAAPGPARRA